MFFWGVDSLAFADWVHFCLMLYIVLGGVGERVLSSCCWMSFLLVVHWHRFHFVCQVSLQMVNPERVPFFRQGHGRLCFEQANKISRNSISVKLGRGSSIRIFRKIGWGLMGTIRNDPLESPALWEGVLLVSSQASRSTIHSQIHRPMALDVWKLLCLGVGTVFFSATSSPLAHLT